MANWQFAPEQGSNYLVVQFLAHHTISIMNPIKQEFLECNVKTFLIPVFQYMNILLYLLIRGQILTEILALSLKKMYLKYHQQNGSHFIQA